ncbi:MAG: hypothetical protein RBU29_05125 [bacterium]|nr:hypothetical protein [bacterium]
MPWWLIPLGGGAPVLRAKAAQSNVVIVSSDTEAFFSSMTRDVVSTLEGFHAPFTLGDLGDTATAPPRMAMFQSPDPVYTNPFDGSALAEIGFATSGGDGYVTVKDFPQSLQAPPERSDGHGLILACQPGQQVRIITDPALSMVEGPYNIHLYANANHGEGVVSIAILDGPMSESAVLEFHVIVTTNLMDAFTRLTLYHEPKVDAAGAVLPQTIVIQVSAYPTASQALAVYIDNLEIAPVYESYTNNPLLFKTSSF